MGKIGLAALLVGAALWWAIKGELPTDEAKGSGVEPDGAVLAEEFDSPHDVSENAAEGAEPIEASDYALYLNGWRERYPEGDVVETRLKRLSGNRYRLQSLVNTGAGRIPWVLWEEKLEREADGSVSHFGSVAYVGNVFLVEVAPEQIGELELAAFLEEHDLFVERDSSLTDYVCLGFETPSLGKLEALVAAFTDRFPSALAEFDTLHFPGATPNDWDPSRMWGLDTIRARDAWTFEKGDSDTDVVVAIVDTGTQTSHFDIADNLFVNPDDGATPALSGDISGWDFVDNDPDPNDDDGHGTHVAGIAGAKGNNRTGSVGVNWGVKLLPLKVGDQSGLRTSAINDALAYVTLLKQKGINIVATNNSYGSGGSNSSTRNEILRHEELGVLFVAAAGNDGKNMDVSPDAREFPAGYTLDNIISVANSNQEDVLNVSSNYGTTSVDLSAPGTDIYAPYPGNSYAFLSGTSMAAPMVAGAVALLAQAEPELSAAELKARLLQSGDLVESQQDATVTGRRLNLLTLLKPEMRDHAIEVSNVDDFIVLMDSLEGDVEFRLVAHEDANVRASVVYGQGVGDIVSLGNRVYRFEPSSEGQAKIRFVSSLGGVQISAEKTVVVGEVDPIQSGLIHHYSFGGSGSTVEDLAGSANGSVMGATREESEFGPSMRFDSESDKVSFNGQFSESVTIAALVRSDRLAASPHPRIVNMPFYYLYFSTGSEPGVPDGNRETLKFFSFFDIDPDNPDVNQPDIGVWNAPPRSIKENEWYYLVATYNSNHILNTPRLYLNAERQAVRVQNEPRGSIVSAEGVSYIGNNAADSRAFDGLMAEVRIYNRELSAIEVSDLGAALIQGRANEFELRGPELVAAGETFEFQVVGQSSENASYEVDWHVVGESPFEVVTQSGSAGKVRFGEAGSAKLVAQVSDGLSTRVVVKEINVVGSWVKAGLAGGQPAGSGSNGAYFEFVALGEGSSGVLQQGRFAVATMHGLEGKAYSLLSADGKGYYLDFAGAESAAADIARLIRSEGIALDSLNVAGIRAQVPLSVSGVGAVAFSVVGESPREVLLRALGPSFSSRGAIDPKLELFRLAEDEVVSVAENDDWATVLAVSGEQESDAQVLLEQGFEQLGLSILDSSASDAAVRLWLAPGEYVLIVERASGDGGAALMEVFGL